MRRPTRKWEGLSSIKVGDKLAFQIPTMGSPSKVTVHGIIKVEDGILHFYSDYMRNGAGSITAGFARSIDERWITHWRGKKLPKGRLDRSAGVSSSTRNKQTAQVGLPIKGGAI